MKTLILTAMFVLMPQAMASVTFYTGDNCTGYYFARLDGRISNLKKVTFKYPCIETISFGHDQQIEKEVWGECEDNFNDKLKSVKITEEEEVDLYEAKDFEMRLETIKGTGCIQIDELRNLGSSLRIER